MQVEAEVDACVGAGQCALVAPEVFDQDDDGLVIVLDHQPGDLAPVQDAVRLCPARALRLVRA